MIICTCFRFISHVTNGICVVLNYSCAILQNAHKHLNDALQASPKRILAAALLPLNNEKWYVHYSLSAMLASVNFLLFFGVSNNRSWWNLYWKESLFLSLFYIDWRLQFWDVSRKLGWFSGLTNFRTIPVLDASKNLIWNLIQKEPFRKVSDYIITKLAIQRDNKNTANRLEMLRSYKFMIHF